MLIYKLNKFESSALPGHRTECSRRHLIGCVIVRVITTKAHCRTFGQAEVIISRSVRFKLIVCLVPLFLFPSSSWMSSRWSMTMSVAGGRGERTTAWSWPVIVVTHTQCCLHSKWESSLASCNLFGEDYKYRDQHSWRPNRGTHPNECKPNAIIFGLDTRCYFDRAQICYRRRRRRRLQLENSKYKRVSNHKNKKKKSKLFLGIKHKSFKFGLIEFESSTILVFIVWPVFIDSSQWRHRVLSAPPPTEAHPVPENNQRPSYHLSEWRSAALFLANTSTENSSTIWKVTGNGRALFVLVRLAWKVWRVIFLLSVPTIFRVYTIFPVNGLGEKNLHF